MNRKEAYDYIGEIAMGLYPKKLKINLTSLNTILKEKGAAYKSNRGLARGLSAAYRYWQKKDPLIHTAIAHSFTDKHGNPAWKNYE